MKGYEKLDTRAHCKDCEWFETGSEDCLGKAKKHRKEENHEVEVSISFVKTYYPKYLKEVKNE